MEYRFESYTLDVGCRELRCGGQLRHVEPQVFDLLHFLVANRDRVVSRDGIFQAVWHGRIVSDGVLSTRINAARAAIDDDGTRQRLIRTVRGGGFRFVGTVFAGAHAQPAPKTYRLATALSDAPVVAILPFTSIRNDKHGELIGRALTEEIAAGLHDIDWLLVASSQHSAGPPGNLKELARILHARYLLHTSTRQQDSETRTIIRLIDAATSIQLWARSFVLPIPDSFEAVASTAARAISDHIFAQETFRSRQKTPESRQAWDAIVCALALISSRKPQDARAAQALLRKAITIDGKSSAAFGLSSFVATLGVHQGWHSRQAVEHLAPRLAERAITLNDEDPWGHVAAGYASLFVRNSPEQAIEILKRALSLNPNLAIAHYFIAIASTYINKPEEAFRRADLAERLRPLDLLARGNAGAHDNVRATASFVAGQYDAGISYARKAIGQSPRQVSAYRQLVVNSAMAGQIGEAARALQTVRRLTPKIQTFIGGSRSLWPDHRKYVEAFRMAGHR